MNKVLVSDLGAMHSYDMVAATFQAFGPCKCIMKKKEDFANIQFESPRAAEKAVEAMNGKDFFGKTIRVEIGESSGAARS